MAKTFKLEVVTPERLVFSEDIVELRVPAHEGYLGVLAGHSPFLGTLRSGEIKIFDGREERYLATSGGFLEITPQKTVILSESVERADTIDVPRAERALTRAKERLSLTTPDIDRERAREALDRAENRLRIARQRTKHS